MEQETIIEILDSLIENANNGNNLEIGEVCRFNKDYITDEELHSLLEYDFEDYKVYSDFKDYNFIVIERTK